MKSITLRRVIIFSERDHFKSDRAQAKRSLYAVARIVIKLTENDHISVIALNRSDHNAQSDRAQQKRSQRFRK